jgi:hypothetical protein
MSGGDGKCHDLTTDNRNCGMCGTTCPSGQVCSGGTCSTTCAAGTTLCTGDGKCHDLATDSRNCGGCGVTCLAGSTCSGGMCVPTCSFGLTACSGVCSNLSIDPNNCGACGMACPSRAGATAVCTGSACAFVCSGSRADCNRVATDGCEIDVNTDRNNCGKCGNVCATGQSCTAGVCTSPTATLTFPNTGDTETLGSPPYFWNAGDFYQGVRTTSLATTTSFSTTIQLTTNSLSSGCGTINLQVSINGTLIGTKTINTASGLSVPMSFTYPAISGPNFTIRYSNPTTVTSGCGSIQFTKNVSTVTLN